ncbi:MAG: hypothetical protein K0S71_2425 [Clostridia bacterium]|nr:hypothetical protein [Clostridia bacterium]
MGTVHRAIYNKAGVSEKVRAAILEEVERCNFQVDTAASVLRRNEVNIAVVLPIATGEGRYFFESLWEGAKEIEKELKKSKVNFHFIPMENDINDQNRVLAKLYDENADQLHGLLTIAWDEDGAVEWINRYSNRGVPVVLVNTDAKNSKRICYVAAPNRKSGQLAGEAMCKFIGTGTGKIVVLAGKENIHSHKVSVEGFESYVNDFKSECEMLKIYGFGEQKLKDKLIKMLKENGDVTGIFSCNARNTYVLCKVIKSLNLSGKISVVGTDVFKEILEFFDDGTLTASIYQYPKLQVMKALQILYDYIAFNTECNPIEQVPIGLVMKSNYEYYL